MFDVLKEIGRQSIINRNNYLALEAPTSIRHPVVQDFSWKLRATRTVVSLVLKKILRIISYFCIKILREA